MGEIGLPRREFLHDLRWWEAASIVRGYRRRHRLTHQLLAEVVYAAMYSMRDAGGKTVGDLFPMLFDDDNSDPPVTEEEKRDLQALIDEVNMAGGWH